MLSQVRVSGTVVQPVLEQGAEGLKLDDYMRLPVAHMVDASCHHVMHHAILDRALLPELEERN